MAYRLTFPIVLGASQTGLTLTAQLVTVLGVDSGALISGAIVEISGGNYLFDSAAIPSAFRGGIKILSGATVKAFTSISPSDAEFIDVAVSSVAAAGSGANTVTITVTDDDANVLPGISVTIKNAAESDAGIVQTTDALGLAVFGLDDGDYSVIIRSSPAYTTLTSQALEVDGTTDATYELAPLVIASPSAAELCVVYGWLIDEEGAPIVGAVITYTPVNTGPVKVGDSLLDVTPQTATSIAEGFHSIELVRSASLDPVREDSSVQYRVDCPQANMYAAKTKITVPDEDSVNLQDLLV